MHFEICLLFFTYIKSNLRLCYKNSNLQLNLIIKLEHRSLSYDLGFSLNTL